MYDSKNFYFNSIWPYHKYSDKKELFNETVVFFRGILLKLRNLRYLPKVMEKKLGLAIIGSLLGIPICLMLWYFDPMEEIVIGQVITSLIGGIITISFFSIRHILKTKDFISRFNNFRFNLEPKIFTYF